MTQPPSLMNWLSIGALGIIWGATFMITAIALEGYGPLTLAFLRSLLGALCLLAAARLLRAPFSALTWRHLRYLVVIGLFNTALPFALLAWGQQFVASAFAGIAMAAVPLFLLPLAHFFSDEPLQRHRVAGVVTGFAGAAVLIGPGLLQTGASMAGWGQLACLGAALSYAIASVLTRRCPPIDPLVMSALLLSVGALALLPAMLWVEGLPEPGALAVLRPTLALIVLGLVPTGFAAFLRIHTIRTAGSLFLSVVSYQVPVWAMVFGAWILSEALPLRFFIALGLILTGLLISQWAALRRLFV